MTYVCAFTTWDVVPPPRCTEGKVRLKKEAGHSRPAGGAFHKHGN